ncbi:MAG TPA: CDGSH iron-sulfur domain-containing protein [Acetobacteraceae bacterium]|jgi:CDGSH iron-sulfur domain-containing protein 3|nr:CDGSH iron-sulfur domain-containing protein [Acetobacteraceae bacterium]
MAAISIRFRENGSIVIDLPAGTAFTLDGEVQTLERAKLALCRCGQSAQKPLCDGSHKRAGFTAPASSLSVPVPDEPS